MRVERPADYDETVTKLHEDIFEALDSRMYELCPKRDGEDGRAIIKTEDVFPGKGSVVRVAFVRNEYPGFGGGVNLYLNGVQIIELVAFTPRGGVEFPPFDGGYVAGDGAAVEQEPEKDDAAKEAEAHSERTLPF